MSTLIGLDDIDLDDIDDEASTVPATATATKPARPTRPTPIVVAPTKPPGHQLSNFGTPHSPELREKVRLVYERESLSDYALSKRFGIAHKTLRRWIVREGWNRAKAATKAAAKLTAKQYVDREAAIYAADGSALIKETLGDAKAVMLAARKIIRTATKPKDLSEAVTAWRGAIAERRKALGLDDAGDDRPRSLVSVNITGAEHVLSGVPIIEAELMPVPVLDDAPALPAS